MIMADVLTILLIIVGAMLMFNAHWLAAYALLPDMVRRSEANYRRPFATTGLGLVVALPLVALGAVLLRAPSPFGLVIGSVLLGAPCVAGLAGSAGLAARIGRGLASSTDESQPWRPVMRGGVVLCFMMLLPFFGWIILSLWTLFSGLGAITMAWFQRSKERKSAVKKAGISADGATDSPPVIASENAPAS